MELTCEMVKMNGQMRARVAAKYSSDDAAYVDCISLDSARSRKRFTRTVMEMSGVSEDLIERELLKIAEQQANQPPLSRVKSDRQPSPLTEQQRAEAEKFLRSPDLLDRIARDIREMGVEGERGVGLTTYLVLTSRLLSTPLKALVQGPSSAGKTFIVETVGGLFPESGLFRATSLSDQAWYYLPEGAIRHKAVVLGEREQSNDPARIDARRAWRELMVSGEASRVLTVTDPATGEPRTVKKTVQGPCAFIETTTSESIMEEDASRMLSLRPCESRCQTLRVIERAALDASGQGIRQGERDQIIARHHAVQRVLEDHTGIEILIPYARSISIPTDQIIARRAFGYVLAMVRSVALLRILQKPHGLRCQADISDYEIAYPLIGPLIERQLSSVTDVDRTTIDRIRESDLEVFTASDVARLSGIGDRQARRRVARFHSIGVVQETEESRRNRREYRLRGNSVAHTGPGLTTPQELREGLAERETAASEHKSSVGDREGWVSDDT